MQRLERRALENVRVPDKKHVASTKPTHMHKADEDGLESGPEDLKRGHYEEQTRHPAEHEASERRQQLYVIDIFAALDRLYEHRHGHEHVNEAGREREQA